MSEPIAEHDDGSVEGVVRVQVVNPAVSESGNKAPERSSFSTFDIVAGSLVRLVSRNARRSNCVITVQNPRGAAVAPPGAYVVIGNRNKAQNNAGGSYLVGASVMYNGEQEIWCAADPAGDALTVTVLDEWDRDAN